MFLWIKKNNWRPLRILITHTRENICRLAAVSTTTESVKGKSVHFFNLTLVRSPCDRQGKCRKWYYSVLKWALHRPKIERSRRRSRRKARRCTWLEWEGSLSNVTPRSRRCRRRSRQMEIGADETHEKPLTQRQNEDIPNNDSKIY